MAQGRVGPEPVAQGSVPEPEVWATGAPERAPRSFA